MTGTTYYEVLGVSQGATADEVHAAYRRAIALVHPDRAGEAGSALAVLINAAHDVLSDPARRAAYDADLAGAGSADDDDEGWEDDDDDGWVVDDRPTAPPPTAQPSSPSPTPSPTPSPRPSPSSYTPNIRPRPLLLRRVPRAGWLTLATVGVLVAVALGHLTPWATAAAVTIDTAVLTRWCTHMWLRVVVLVLGIIVLSMAATVRIGTRAEHLAPTAAIPAATVAAGIYVVVSRRLH